MTLKFFAAYLLISGGLVCWIDMAKGCTYNADQIVGLTIMFAIAGVIIQKIIEQWAAYRAPRPQPEIDIRSLFEEV
jgi:uncharacterized membrane protein